MNHKLITTHPDYWLLVDTEAPIEAMKTPTYNEVVPWGEFRCGISLSKERPMSGDGKVNLFEGIHAIIAHLPKHDNAPVLEDVPLLPELPKQKEDDIAVKAEEFYNKENPNQHWTIGSNFGHSVARFLKGYKASTKKWDDEDIRKAVKKGILLGLGRYTTQTPKVEEYLQSLSPVPVGFEPEYGYTETDEYIPDSQSDEGGYYEMKEVIKTTKTTFRGKEVEVIQGRWIYE